jgi:hypothetical protein
MKIGEYYRNHGLSEKLISYFLEIYRKEYSDYPLSIEFINPIAEYVFQKVLREKNMSHVLTENLTRRYYEPRKYENFTEILETLKQKDPTIFPLNIIDYVGCEEKAAV